MKRFVVVTVACAILGVAPCAETPSFSRDIQPILSNNCYLCHGTDANTREAELRLDTEESARGILESGEFLRRITTDDPNDRMPPSDSGKSLSDADITKLRAWLDAGAPYERHWAFVAATRTPPPDVANASWPRNAIDHFTLARMEAVGLTPADEADKVTLIRRAYLDIIGLPPTPEEIDSFLRDERDDAYERIVDDLFQSPHYGERWARHWLDSARYADSNGYSIDGERSIWPYRDWVINAFNTGLPYDQFIIEQLAGDLLPNATREQRVATGFNRNTMINQEGGIDEEEFRIEALFDRVNTLGSVMLGLTLSCARCHSHKYDPIEHFEYYQLMAFFNDDNEPTLELPEQHHLDAQAEIKKDVQEVRDELEAYLLEAEADAIPAWEKTVTLDAVQAYPADARQALVTPSAERDDAQKKLVREVFAESDKKAVSLSRKIQRIMNKAPKVPSTMVLAARAEPRETTIFLQGDFTRKGDVVSHGTPAALHPMPESAPKNRLGLAQWLVDPQNPLTARVAVNRVWQRLFGRGIVETENDFGLQSIPPSHPELLDWLAIEFVESGWDMRHLIRTIVTSSTYRQSSHSRSEVDSLDPRNVLLARQNRLRLDAEIIRDNALVVSGLFNPTIGGPSVHPPQPDGVMSLGQRNVAWNESAGDDRYRRGMYTFFWRGTPYPALTVFDAPTAQFSCTRRVRSNTPLQALTLLNDPAYVEMAQAFGEEIQRGGEDDHQRIVYAFERAVGRQPTSEEIAILTDFVDRERAATQDDTATWVALARTIINTDEFITRE